MNADGTVGRSPIRERVDPQNDLRFIDIRAVFATIWLRRFLIALMGVLFAGIAFVVVQRMTPIYTADTLVMMNTRKTTVVDIESVVSGLPSDAKFVEGEISVITSNQLLERVVKVLHLENDPEFNSALRPEKFYKGWIASLKSSLPADLRLALGISDDKLEDPILKQQREHLSVVNSLGRSLDISQHGLSVVIKIEVESESPTKAALIANTIADQYLVDQLEAKFEATQRATSWLGDRVTELRDRVEQAEAAVAAYKETLALGEGQGLEITNQQLGQLNGQLVEARAGLAEAEARYGQVKRRIDEGGLTAAANVLSSPLILSLRQQGAELARKAAELSTRYGERHPSMINVRAEIRDVNGAIASEVRKIIEGLSNDVEIAQARANALAESLVQVETKALGQSKTSLQLRQLEREAEASRLIYENFLNRYKETSGQESLQEADARVISRAQPPGGPTKPQKSLLITIAGVFGVAVGMGLAFLLEALNNTFRTSQELETVTGEPVLASLPRLGRHRQRHQLLSYLNDNPNSALAESIRNLRTALFLANIDAPPKTVMFTSALAGESKSTTCILLAHMTMQIGKSAIVVECDIRRPTIHNTFSITDGPDIFSVLEGSAELSDAIRVDEASGISILPAIHSTPQAADILASKRFGAMIKQLRDQYDLVLLDSPPVLLVADAGVIGAYADATICAVRWDNTPREATVQALKRLDEYGLRVSGTVLTMIDRDRAAQYSYGRDGYAYYGGRNAYYSD